MSKKTMTRGQVNRMLECMFDSDEVYMQVLNKGVPTQVAITHAQSNAITHTIDLFGEISPENAPVKDILDTVKQLADCANAVAREIDKVKLFVKGAIVKCPDAPIKETLGRLKDIEEQVGEVYQQLYFFGSIVNDIRVFEHLYKEFLKAHVERWEERHGIS